jgi:hypothetical protein
MREYIKSLERSAVLLRQMAKDIPGCGDDFVALLSGAHALDRQVEEGKLLIERIEKVDRSRLLEATDTDG